MRRLNERHRSTKRHRASNGNLQEARIDGKRKDVLTERQRLPTEIATLSAEGKRLVETIAEVTGTARRLVDERLQEIGDELGRLEARFAVVEREVAHLEAIDVDGRVGREVPGGFQQYLGRAYA